MDEKTFESRRAKVTNEHRAEAARLKQLWSDWKAVNRGSQAAFGHEFGIGSQAAVGFFLNGQTPLSLKAAQGFALGLGCRVAEFSPRLASAIEEISQTDQRTKLASGPPLKPDAAMLARAFNSVLDHTPELAAKRNLLFGNLWVLIDLALHGSAGTHALTQLEQPTQTPASLSKTRL